MAQTSAKRRQLLAASLASPLAWAAAPLGLSAALPVVAAELPEKIRKSGILRVAMYRDLAPYHDNGAGIDVDIAQRLAEKLGLKLSLLPFDADDNLNDDLRNMVWKGHYMGYGPADLMMHVPVDRGIMTQNPQVVVFGPYHREVIRMAHDPQQVADFKGLPSLVGKPIGVDGTSLSAMLLTSADDGRHRATLKVYKSTLEALAALKKAELAGVIGHASELEAGLKGDSRYTLSDSPFDGPARRGWPVGFSAKKDQAGLIALTQDAIKEMLASGEILAIFNKYGVALRAA